MNDVKTTIDMGDVENTLKSARHRAKDLTPAWKKVRRYMGVVTDKTFMKLRFGGTYRDVSWKYFSPSYIGQKRPSGAIVKVGDSVVQDTGTLRNTATLGVVKISKKKMTIGTNLKYAAKQASMRKFLFFTQEDKAVITKDIVADYLVNGT